MWSRISIDAYRWTTQTDKVNTRIDVLPDDAISNVMNSLADKSSSSICAWVTYRPENALDAAKSICRSAMRPDGIASTQDIANLTATYAEPRHSQALAKKVPVVTWKQAVMTMASDMSKSISESIGNVPVGQRVVHPNPFLSRAPLNHTPVLITSALNRTLESYGLCELNYATIDDVRAHFKKTGSGDTRHYFHEVQSGQSGQSGHVDLSIDVLVPPSLHVKVKSLHVRVSRGELDASLHPIQLEETFEDVALSGEYQIARINKQIRIHRSLVPSPEVERVLKTDDAYALFSIRDTGSWSVAATPVKDGGARLDIRLSKGSIDLDDVQPCFESISRKLKQFQISSPWTEETRDGFSQRFISATVVTMLKSSESTPSLEMLSSSFLEMGAFFGNVEIVKSTLVAQYRRTNGYRPVSPFEQTVLTNLSMPPHVLVGLLVERHGFQSDAAQRMLDEVYATRDATMLNPPTFVIVKPVRNVGITITIHGLHEISLIQRIVALTLHAGKIKASVSSEEIDDVFDDDIDELNDIFKVEVENTQLQDLKVQDAEVDIPGRYMISELHRADAKLFDTGNKGKRYSRICGHVNLRQPIRVSQEEIERIERANPGSISGSVSAGTVASNRYVCPKVWCPKSRVAMTLAQYDAAQKRCPGIREDAMVFDDDHYWNGRDRFPGFLDPKYHPDGLCMPCCFLKPDRKKGRCKVDVKEEVQGREETGNVRYVYGATSTLPNGRFGLLPTSLHEIFNAGSVCAKHPVSHLTNRSACVLRKGVPSGMSSVFEAISLVVGVPSLIATIREHLDTDTFIALHGGAIARAFVPASMQRSLADTVSIESFVSWFKGRAKARDDVYEYIASGAFAKSASSGRFFDKTMLRATREFTLFVSMTNYLDELERTRTHHLLVDLVNMAPEWLNATRIALVVLVRDAVIDEYTLSCPMSVEFNPNAQRVAFIIQHGEQYDVLTHVAGIRGGLDETYAFDSVRSPGIRGVLTTLQTMCSMPLNTTRAGSIIRFMKLLGDAVKSQVVDYEMRCVGLMSESGIVVPLPESDALVLSKEIKLVFIDDMVGEMLDDGSPARERHVTVFFRRLAAATGIAGFDVARVVQGPSGGRSLLLNMGKTSPLSLDGDMRERYLEHINAFIDVPITDARVKEMEEIEERYIFIRKARKAYFAACQDDAPSYENIREIINESCGLPWDVRHKYMTWSVNKWVPWLTRELAEEVADMILISSSKRGRRILSDPDVVTVSIDDIGRLSEILTSEILTTKLCPTTLDGAVDIAYNFPPDLVPSAATALSAFSEDQSLDSQKSQRTIVSKASLRAKSSLSSIKKSSSKKKKNMKRIEMISVPLTSDVALDVMLYANTVMHPGAPVSRDSLRLLVGTDVYAAFREMGTFLGVPVAVLVEGKFVSDTPREDAAVLLARSNSAEKYDVLFSRKDQRSLHMFGVLASMRDLSDPNVSIVVPSVKRSQ